jgi:nucleolar complex protein 2
MLFLQLKQFLKTCSVTNFTKKMRQLLEKIEENSRFIERERAKVSFPLHDDKLITAWETSIKTKGTPLSTFYENWSKINKIQKRKKVTKNDELAGELPMIKRPKISEDIVNKTKPEKKGPLVLFPSDSEDEGNNFKVDDKGEVSVAKAKKLKKKKPLQKKANKKVRQQSESEDEVTDNKEDIVQDFSVSDW